MRMTSRIKSGFTLVEVLLVAVIIGFVAAIATPSFVNSLKGQRLRQATRSVMACGRFARTMAVARQRSMNVVLTIGGNRISVEQGPPPRVVSEQVYTRDQVTAISNGPSLDIAAPPPPPPAPGGETAQPQQGLSRLLEGIVVKSVEIRNGKTGGEEGTVSVPYKSNGTCPPYTVVLVDEDGRESTIETDFLGDATHEE